MTSRKLGIFNSPPPPRSHSVTILYPKPYVLVSQKDQKTSPLCVSSFVNDPLGTERAKRTNINKF